MPKKDQQAGQFDVAWNSKTAIALIEEMDENREAHKAFVVAQTKFKEAFATFIEDADHGPGTRVRMGEWVTTVMEREREEGTTKAWHSLGRGQITLLEPGLE